MRQQQFDSDFEAMPDTECLEHPFMDFVVSESRVTYAELAWEKWVNDAEGLLGFELDGDQKTDGYSIDDAYGAFEADVTPQEYADEVRANIAARGKQIPHF